jgi:hypothetical protein
MKGDRIMKKKLLLLLVTILILFSSISAAAAATEKPITSNTKIIASVTAQVPVIYKSKITVTEDGDRFKVGFVNIEFKKNFLDPIMLPATFEVEIYAENGLAYIGFTPDEAAFNNKVHLRVDAYNGLLYDIAKNQNVTVHVKKQQLLLEHFSHYCF